MNREAKLAGAASSNFVNPHGLGDPKHYSTARDLAAIACAAMRDPQFEAAARTRSYDVPRDTGRPPTRITNRNDLLWTFPGADGIKTGWTRAAGFCFVGSATQNGRRIISVVLRSPDWRSETAALLQYGFAHLGIALPPVSPRPAAGSPPAEGLPDAEVPESLTPGQALTPSPSSKNGGGVTGQQAVPESSLATHMPGLARAAESPRSQNWDRGDAGANASGTPSSVRVFPGIGNTPSPTPRAAESPLSQNWERGVGAFALRTLCGVRAFRGVRAFALRTLCGVRAFRGVGAAALHALRGVRAFWLLLLLLLLLFISRRKRMRSILSTFKAISRRRADPEPARDCEPPAPARAAPDSRPLLCVASLSRLPSAEWLERVLDSPQIQNARIRRVAAAVLEADPRAWLDRLETPLRSESAQDRLAAADLLAGIRPAPAEQALTELIEDSPTPDGTREEAIRRLAGGDSDRFEALFLRRLMAGSHEAARALACLARIEEPTADALRRLALQQDQDEAGAGRLRQALAAAVLAAHDRIDAERAVELLAALPLPERNALRSNVLAHSRAACAQSLLADSALWTDAPGESERQMEQWCFAGAGPDALLAAAQIVSVRMGFTDHSPDGISSAFQSAAADRSRSSAPPELQSLAAAYEDPAVRKAVHAAMHSETGLPTLIGALTHYSGHSAVDAELAFWSDKLPAGHRLLVSHALMSSSDPAAESAIAALRQDADPLVRAAVEMQAAPEVQERRLAA
jgi:hypothetical protein